MKTMELLNFVELWTYLKISISLQSITTGCQSLKLLSQKSDYDKISPRSVRAKLVITNYNITTTETIYGAVSLWDWVAINFPLNT